MKRIGDILTRNKSAVVVEDVTGYKQVTIRTNYKGVVLRGTQVGSTIHTKNQSSSKPASRPVAATKTGITPIINKSKWAGIVIPLLPLAEQEAIVERLEALMTTCRALEAEFEHARTHAAHLLQAVLKEAFAPDSA